MSATLRINELSSTSRLSLPWRDLSLPGLAVAVLLASTSHCHPYSLAVAQAVRGWWCVVLKKE
ncbi:hypothetical protein [Pseudodesulfovibrio nedwellii]|uniref:hypothetical protein n=1 Tax=Pseudodesulfovibrio nedwellii TaxID=2973072 RepID=UPI002493534D|nr:hypothetical protein [Pseudodesulfovibrio nedwellii]